MKQILVKFISINAIKEWFSNFKFIPTFVFSCVELISFYLFYVLQSVNFALIASLISSIFSLIIFLSFRKRKISQKAFLFLLCILLSIVVSFISYIKFLNLNLSFSTLAKEKNIQTVTVCLLNDAKPKGKKYYELTAQILKCKCKDGSIYSCSGCILILLPSAFIRQNYMGSATLKRGAEEITLFCKGVVMETDGHFIIKNKKDIPFYSKKVFVADNDSSPKFLHFSSIVYAWRVHLRFYINRLLYGWRGAGYLLLSLLTSNRDFLEAEEVEAFRNAGLSHILALSGMHLAIVGSFATFFTSFFLCKKSVKAFVVIFSFVFLVFAGVSPSLLRAFIMLLIASISYKYSNKINLLGILSFTLSLHLILFPQDALTLSFALSYAALFGILTFGDAIYYFLNPYLPDILSESISASLGATFFTFPIIALTIGKISISGIIATVLVSPLISIFLSTGIFFMFLSMIIQQVYDLSGMWLNWLYDIIMGLVHIFSIFPLLQFENKVSSYIIACIPLVLGCIFMYTKSKIEKNFYKR